MGASFDKECEKIMKFLLKQKNVFISTDILNTCFDAKNDRMMALLFRSRKLRNEECCATVIHIIERGKVGKGLKFICEMMEVRIRRCVNVNQKQMMQRIQKWLRRRIYRKNRVWLGQNSGLAALKQDFQNVDWTK